MAKAAALLVKDHAEAAGEAAKAAECVRIKANAVMDCVGHRIVSELIAGHRASVKPPSEPKDEFEEDHRPSKASACSAIFRSRYLDRPEREEAEPEEIVDA